MFSIEIYPIELHDILWDLACLPYNVRCEIIWEWCNQCTINHLFTINILPWWCKAPAWWTEDDYNNFYDWNNTYNINALN